MTDWKDKKNGTIPERVFGYLREVAPNPVCDGCIEKVTGVSAANINPVTQTLGLTSDFAKGNAPCSICHEIKLATRFRR